MVAIYRRGEKGRAEASENTRGLAEITRALAASQNEFATSQNELAGRLKTLSDNQAMAQHHAAERVQAQERAISKTLEERLSHLSQRLGENLNQQAHKNSETMSALHERLAVIDTAQKNLTELSSKVLGLQDILSNKQARGAFGEIQLNDLVKNSLPPSAYDFQVTLSNGKRADCLLILPNPPGPIVVDSKFPLESYQVLVEAQDDIAKVQAGRAFSADILKHVKDIAERYIITGETAESALMFLPSEAVYAELHANFRNVVEESFKRRVWIVSPTTMMATLNTIRAVLKDAQMREQAGLIQKEVATMMDDVGRLDQRVENLQKHFDQTTRDVDQIRTSTKKVISRGEKIRNVELGEESPAEELEPPKPQLDVV
ncbi:MAG: DNA recombination protein RmuC [Rhodospirillales bacterium]|nr:DNA recombination protein RmuC [Rhodospirillales bacterium]